MLTEKEIVEIANKYIQEIEKRTGIELLIGDEETIKKPYGNIYFYTSKKWYETGGDKYAVAGNAPFLVERDRKHYCFWYRLYGRLLYQRIRSRKMA